MIAFRTNEITDANPETDQAVVTFKSEATQTPAPDETNKVTEEKGTQTTKNEILCFQIKKESMTKWGKIGFDIFVNFVLQAVDEGTDLYTGIRYI